MADNIEKSGSTNKYGAIVPILGIAAIGIGGWKLFDYLDKEREREEIEKSTKATAASEVEIQKRKEAINKIETTAYVEGINGYGKKKTVNIVAQAKDLVNLFTIMLHGTGQFKYVEYYYLRSPEKIKANEQKIRSIIFETPLNNLSRLAVIYNIYTRRNLLEDCSKLSLNTYTEVKKLYEIAYKKYPKTFNK